MFLEEDYHNYIIRKHPLLGFLGKPDDFLLKLQEKTINKYLDSLVPLGEYKKHYNYDVPEVVCFSDISIEKITPLFCVDKYDYLKRKSAQFMEPSANEHLGMT